MDLPHLTALIDREKRDGGPVFPHQQTGAQGEIYGHQGMSLRDYIAIHAGPHVRFAGLVEVKSGEFARLCYDFADTMIAERNRRNAE